MKNLSYEMKLKNNLKYLLNLLITFKNFLIISNYF